MQKGRNLQVSRSEILSPLADAVGFIHNHLRDLRLHGKIQKALRSQPLRGNVNDPVCPLNGPFQCHLLLLSRQGAVDIGRFHAVLHQSTDLIFHKRDERGNHQGDSLAQKRRDLVAQRFSGARRHHRQQVLSGKQRFYRFSLPRTEAVISEDLFQRPLCVFQIGHVRASSLYY